MGIIGILLWKMHESLRIEKIIFSLGMVWEFIGFFDVIPMICVFFAARRPTIQGLSWFVHRSPGVSN